MTVRAVTRTDIAAREWAIDDNVVRLREWGTETGCVLPSMPDSRLAGEWTVGAGETCALRLNDPSGLMSRLHARLVRSKTGWVLQDLSKNGLRLDGAKHPEILLLPGTEIGIGGLTLIAESGRSITLRGFLMRLLGWRSDRMDVVDQALRSVRMAATHRIALVLRGEGDVVPMARSIHRRALGPERPFIVCDPRRRQGRATVRSAENYETGMPAFEAAFGGSLCVRSLRLPRDFKSVLLKLKDPNARVQLVVCAQPAEDWAPLLSIPINVPPLSSRAEELDQIITEYAEDAIAELGTARTGFLPADREWVRMHSATSLPDIEKATLRLVAIRESRNLSNAAARLGMAPVSLARWIGRRKLPMHVDP
jgi:pSer/pThr/pTyr-binding forkhead associated (FHA) protein